jgi:flagellin
LTNLANSTLNTGSYTINVTSITAASATITSDPFDLLDNIALGGTYGDPDGLAGGSHSVVVSEATGAYVTSSTAAVMDGNSTLTAGTTITIASAATTNVVTFEGDELNTVADIVAEINAEVSSDFIAVNNNDGTYSIAINNNSTAVGADQTITVTVSGGVEQDFGFATASVTAANGQNVGVQLDDGDMVYLTTTAAASGFVVTAANGGSLALTLETAFTTWDVIDGGTLNVELTPASFDVQLGSGPKVTFNSGETKTLSAGEDSQGNPIGTLDISFGYFNVPATDSSVTVSVVDNSIQFQVGPNANETVKISAQDISADKLARGLITSSNFISLEQINVTTVQGANDSLLLIDTAIDEITTLRAKLGAFQQNTLETNLRSLRVAEENLSASESTIRDVDISIEVTEFTRNQILLSAGVSVLAQANAIPQTVLQLLG